MRQTTNQNQQNSRVHDMVCRTAPHKKNGLCLIQKTKSKKPKNIRWPSMCMCIFGHLTKQC